MKKRGDRVFILGIFFIFVYLIALNLAMAEVDFPKPPQSPTDYGPGQVNETAPVVPVTYSQGEEVNNLNVTRTSDENFIFGKYNASSFWKLILVLFILIIIGLTIKYFVDKYK